MHECHVEPGLFGKVEDEGTAGLSIGEPIELSLITCDGELGVDSAALGEQHPLAEGEHLHREADVDRELEQQCLIAWARRSVTVLPS